MLRQEQLGQDGFADGVQLQERDNFDFRKSRVRFASRDVWYFRDSDYGTGSEQSYGRQVPWGIAILRILGMVQRDITRQGKCFSRCDS